MPDPASDATDVPDLLARDRRDGAPALHASESDRTYSYHDLCTTAYKVGNVLSHLGVRRGDRVAIEPRRAPEPVLTFLGAALLGATAGFRVDDGTDARAVLVHVDREAGLALPPGSRLLAFGGEPDRPTTTHWEAEVWSENPAFPPTEYDPTDAVLVAEGETFPHRDLLEVASGVVDSLDLDGESSVTPRAPLSDPRAVAAGVLAPLLVGGAIRLPSGGEDGAGTVAVTDGDAGTGDGTLDLTDVRL
ncbi:AMP-binding protein [Halorarum salinum]|uniref:AMP-binding protein n=1 Tax=Halorarum salinum TaxID=2743089 RepID=A0A7D5QC45_9EURY|nr:AMP-binding protein [Halobaculum salinum]QLG62360.1 AMP-binding protein [Halobaculum salinum]